MAIDLQELGLTREDIQERVAEMLCASLLTDDCDTPIRKLVQQRIDQHMIALAEQHILPNVARYVENVTLQETNKWGEKMGQSMSFVEYLVARAEAYLREEVDYDGKSKGEATGYSWTKSQTRITHLVHKHLHYTIETAMKDAVQSVQTVLASGLQETVKIKLEELARQLKVSVTTK